MSDLSDKPQPLGFRVKFGTRTPWQWLRDLCIDGDTLTVLRLVNGVILLQNTRTGEVLFVRD